MAGVRGPTSRPPSKSALVAATAATAGCYCASALGKDGHGIFRPKAFAAASAPAICRGSPSTATAADAWVQGFTCTGKLAPPSCRDWGSAAVAAATTVLLRGLRGQFYSSGWLPGRGAASARTQPQGWRVQLFGVAPWLREPENLEDSYGIKRERHESMRDRALKLSEEDEDFDDDERPKGPRRKFTEVRPAGKKLVEAPPAYRSLKERMRTIKPYQDIIDQVEQNYHGRKGVRRLRTHTNVMNKLAAKGKIKMPKPKKPTEIEKIADSLAHSACRQYAKGRLNLPETWPKPDASYPEVAFVGRSNVGKSSLLNLVSHFGSVAKISNMPGMTKHVSWYRNRKVSLAVIDMPGYGHSDRAKLFGPDTLEFVRARKCLKALYVLIDARHGIKRADHQWLSDLGNAGPVKQIILTKCDLVRPRELIQLASLARADLEAYRNVDRRVLLASSQTIQGIHEIRMDIVQRCGLASKPPKKKPFEPIVVRQAQPLGLTLGQYGRAAAPDDTEDPLDDIDLSDL